MAVYCNSLNSHKNNDFLYNGQWYIQATNISMFRDWVPHFADIHMGKFKKKALYQVTSECHTYYPFLTDIFMLWSHGENAFYRFGIW